MPVNYLVSQQASVNVEYIFRLQSFFSSSSSSSYYNNMVVGGPGVHRFWFHTYSGSQYYDSGYVDFVPQVSPFVMTVLNRYKAAGRQTMLELQFTVDVNLDATHTMVLSFDTTNLLKRMFPDDLEGKGTGSDTYRYLDCREWYNNVEVSDSRLVCLLYFGNHLASPPTPANLTISFTKNFYGWSSSRTIRVMVADVQNPAEVGLNTGVKVAINDWCQNQHNLPCPTYEARGYYVTEAAAENSVTSSTTFTSSSTLVLTTGLTHTFTFSLTASIGTSDVIYIIYP